MIVGLANEAKMPRMALIGLFCALAFGVIARLIWPADMEYKGDEVFSFERSQRIGVTEPWSWTGMNNSADVPHPGMSVWVFVGLTRLFGANTPIDLNVACMALNVLALMMLVAFIAKVVPANEREWWWWGTALVAVNPLAVLFHRKIWPPSVLPAITVLLLLGWWYRDRKPWAFFWGLVSALAAQIHPGAFFFSAGMAGWALILDRKSLRWLPAVFGSLIGLIPAIPWICYMLTSADRSAAAKSQWFHPFELKFWNYWMTEPFGFSLQYSLGKDFSEFLRAPTIMGQPTYIVAGLHLILFVLLLLVFTRWIWRWCLNRTWSISRTPTDFTLGAVICGYGFLLTITGLPVYRHYLIITFPLMFVFVARMVFATFQPTNSRKLLTVLTVTQAFVTALFLNYVHQVDRPINGDYGAPYRVQLETKTLTAQKR